MLRPRCWSGKKSSFDPRSKAQSYTFGAFDEVQTMPPLRPQNAFSEAAEFMYVTGITPALSPAPAGVEGSVIPAA